VNKQLVSAIEKHWQQAVELSDDLYAHPELPDQEFRSSQKVVDMLKAAGYEVEYPYMGYPTGFRAVLKNGEGPSAALLIEYDALPELGHACGHNAHCAMAVLAALLVFRRQADDRALLAAAVVLAIGVPFLLPHMHERYFFLADVLALAWACAFPRSAPCALLVELASLGAYVVVLRGKFTLAVSLDGRLFPMLCEALLMLAGLAFAVLSLARRLAFPQKSRE